MLVFLLPEALSPFSRVPIHQALNNLILKKPEDGLGCRVCLQGHTNQNRYVEKVQWGKQQPELQKEKPP